MDPAVARTSESVEDSRLSSQVGGGERNLWVVFG